MVQYILSSMYLQAYGAIYILDKLVSNLKLFAGLQMSPGSPGDSGKKTRRKLPPVPAEAEAFPPRQTRIRSRSADSRGEGDRFTEKERLRQRLRMREIEQRRSFDRSDSEDEQQSGDDRRSRSQTRRSRIDTMPRRRDTTPGGSRRIYSHSLSSSLQNLDFHSADSTSIDAELLSSRTVDVLADIHNLVRGTTEDKSLDHRPTKVGMKGSNGKTVPRLVKPLSLVNFRGVLVPTEIKMMKQRIKEELQIVTATRRLRLDEAEEIRRMEATLAEREKERRVRADRDEKEELLRKEEKRRQMEIGRQLEKELEHERAKKRQSLEHKLQSDMIAATTAASIGKTRYEISGRRTVIVPTATATPPGRVSPQTSPRRTSLHKRQNSDPMIAKFSPIDEDRDVESELRYKLGSEARRLAAGLRRYSPQSLRRLRKSPIIGGTLPRLGKGHYIEDLIHSGPDRSSSAGYGSLSRSTDILAKLAALDREAAHLSSSHSESSLPLTIRGQLIGGHSSFFSESDDRKLNEKIEKKLALQMEIGMRKRHLEETKMLHDEIRKLAEMPDISPTDMETARSLYQQHVRVREQIPTGIIKPLDYQLEMDIGCYSGGSGEDGGLLLQYGHPRSGYNAREYAASQRSDQKAIIMQTMPMETRSKQTSCTGKFSCDCPVTAFSS